MLCLFALEAAAEDLSMGAFVTIDACEAEALSKATPSQPVDSHTVSATTITPTLNTHVRRLRLNIDDL
jgi:hypothetical protein